MKNNIFKKFTCLGLILLLSACSQKELAYKESSIHDIYVQARNSLQAQEYKIAGEQFEEVERQHPYSQWASDAQIMAGYSYYLSGKYEHAISTLESFMQLHPANKNIDYALYMIGQCYYEQISPITRDPRDLIQSYRIFNELVKRFPYTDYAKGAKYKIILLRDMLAGKEMEVARFYMNKKAYHSAIKRFNSVVDLYHTTSYIEESLYRLVECYVAMGLNESAIQTAAILRYNYPNSPWHKEAYYLITRKKIPNGEQLLKDYQGKWWKKFIH